MGVVLIKSLSVVSGDDGVPPTGCLKAKKSVKNQDETSLDSQNEQPL